MLITRPRRDFVQAARTFTYQQVENALADAKKALESQDVPQIRAATDALSRASHKLAEAMYAKASQGGAGPQGGAQPEGGAGSDGASGDKGKDDVVEAEFEEVKE